ncbi:class II fructose-bisphosphate aldolase [Plantactinospora veratri]|uniref:Class II fructose-bisphosphate aldolase n=1 Tax=Plantactinospora veratri TaxID=1436122 RepID=A0ABU7SGJ1_9ACTN
MPLTATGQLVDRARAADTAIVAFNVITLEHAEAIVAGAEQAGRAVILQISENAVRFHHGRLAPIAAAVTAVAELAAVPVAVHLDHVQSPDLLHAAEGAGISSAMFDASTLDYADNVRATVRAVGWAHARGLWLEAELGEVGGKDGAHAPGVRTDPAEAAEFVAATGVDALAVAVGSSHAMTDRTAALDFALIGRLRETLPVPLVLHGSSGVPDDDLVRAVRAGIVKINVGTILNVAFTEAVRAELAAAPVVDPRKYLAPAREAVARTVAHLVSTIS